MIFKNLKIILRNPFTIILLILSPIILMFLVGFAYSSTTFVDVNVGYIGEGENIFSGMKNIEFVGFNGDIKTQVAKCSELLDTGRVDLCIYPETVRDAQGNFISANIVYYVDNTRPQISDLLVNNFNKIIDKTTKEISTKTIKDIFNEVNETVEFMKDSSELITELDSDLNNAIDNVEELEQNLELASSEYETISKEVINTKNKLKTDLSSFSNGIKSFEYALNKLETSIISGDLENSINVLSLGVQNLQSYSNINPDIENYVDIDSLESSVNQLEEFEGTLENNIDQINNIQIQLENFDDINELESLLDDVESKVNDAEEYLSQGQEIVTELKQKLLLRQKELKDIKSEIDSRTKYFEEVSSRNVGEITDPISIEYKIRFENFKRVHQLAPIIVVLVLLFVGLLLSNVIVSQEVNSKAYFRNLISPVSQAKFIFSLFMTSLLIILFELLFLFLILQTNFGINIMPKLGPLLIVVIHLLVIFILVGVILAYMFNSVQVSILTTTFLMLFMFLLSDIIVPLEIMPVYMYNILSYSPVVVGGELLRQIFFFDKFVLNVSQFWMAYVQIVVLIILVAFFSSRRKRKMN
ncbi:MAG: ABC transporter permease [Nanoarchaeota archaeon]